MHRRTRWELNRIEGATAMTASKNIAVALALAGLFALNGNAAKADGASLTMKPQHGISFDVGQKRAVSYFVTDNGLCKLTLIVAQAMTGDEVPTDQPVRFEVAIDGGKNTRLDAAEGHLVDFACAVRAEAMTVTPIEQVAATR
jgi:hypothetical protein